MRSREQSIAIAEKILENYRRNANKYGYYKTSRGHYKQRDEYEDPNEVKLHNATVARFREREKKKKDARERMKKNDTVPTKQGKPMFEDSNKLAAQRKMGSSLAGQTFYSICPDNEKYYRTIYIRFNPFTNAMQPMISNPVYGIPPEGMQPINKTMLANMMRMQMKGDFRDF